MFSSLFAITVLDIIMQIDHFLNMWDSAKDRYSGNTDKKENCCWVMSCVGKGCSQALCSHTEDVQLSSLIKKTILMLIYAQVIHGISVYLS